ncbi:zinc-ribbon domain-containing protein [Halorubrum sp. Atlit-26R]|uniref:zinc-ribbon domain-containing protein n=1 Tax=Halorubrum sp. Atlit-26R TaxID=2282128 RepID=UPI000EF2854D|nr:zinc-ribbon domain-containing protein [Halorubrum sp. Atlit-26R]RLM72793.1 zinc-ribbon domain-containing protein [Halorubrum sp. Atlit-26R]
MVVVEAVWLGSSSLSLLALGFLGCCCGGQQQQQQQILNVNGDTEEPKRVCPECGMENPKDASFCGDCGFSFSRGGDEDE